MISYPQLYQQMFGQQMAAQPPTTQATTAQTPQLLGMPASQWPGGNNLTLAPQASQYVQTNQQPLQQQQMPDTRSGLGSLFASIF